MTERGAGKLREPSPTTAAARRLMAERKPRATKLGAGLADFVNDPEGFVETLGRSLTDLADADCAAGMRAVAPGLGRAYGVRIPLLAALYSGFRARTRRISPSLLLYLADRLLREEEAEVRLLAIWLLERTLPDDSERSWQVLRRVARQAGEWITVDSLAHLYATGILLDPRRWAELEQLVYSPSRWERRLVGSTLATMPFVRGLPGRRDREVARRGLALVAQLIGDDEPDVEKALSWALRSLTLVDAAAVDRFVGAEAETAAATADGHRAWVLRDALGKLAPDRAARVRAALAGVRRRAGSPSTSSAAAIAAEFLAGLPPSAAAEAATTAWGGGTAVPEGASGRSSAA